VAFPASAIELETRHIGADGEPTLHAAFVVLRDHWLAGNRDRETALHLAFLAWYMMVDFGTGYEEVQTEETDIELATMFGEAHEWLDADGTSDPEVVYVFHVMMEVGTLFADEHGGCWEDSRRDAYRKRIQRLWPAGPNPELFAERGFYGDYFRMQSTGG
jgi:hypothetical protein